MKKSWLPKTREKAIKFLLFCWNRYIKGVKIRKPPIFIVGCGHSGTSLLLAILASHSKVYAIPYESEFARNNDDTTIKSRLKRFDMQAIAAGKSSWVEKTPKHIYFIDRLLEFCPNAKILLIIRDGRDVACSIQDRTGSIETGIKRWIEDNRAGQAFWNHPNVYVFKYEQLIENFKQTVSGILDFLDESYEQEMVNYYKTPKYYFSNTIKKPQTAFGENHDQYRNWQINQPLFDGRGKWKRMTEPEQVNVKEQANQMLGAYGYVDNENW